MTAAVAMVMIVTGAVIVSAHGGDSWLIHGCINKDTKFVRIIGANDKCRSNETALDWSIQGIKGDAGPRGPGVTEASASTLTPGSAATANLQAIPGDPEGDLRLLLGIPAGPKGDPGPAGGIGSLSKIVVLHDDATGNAAGWTPDDSEEAFFILDSDAESSSFISVRYDGDAVNSDGDGPRCFVEPFVDAGVGFDVHCADAPREGADLIFLLINP